jgi:hypothetical protein
MDRPGLTEVSVCLFAEGDAATFFAAAGALDAAADGLSCRVVVYDCGLDVWAAAALSAFAEADPAVIVRAAPNGDKAASWNDYVHRAAGPAFIHIFIEGAAAPAPRAFRALADSLAANPGAWGATALPASGASRRSWARKTMLQHGLNRQLYAVSSAFIGEARRREIRLPYGASGLDGIVAYLMLTDFMGGTNDDRPHRIAVADDAFFTFRTLQLRSADLTRWRSRESERAKAKIEAQALYPLLKREGAAAMPLAISEIWRNGGFREARPRRDLVGGHFDRAILSDLSQRFATTPSKTTRPAR